ncbi:motility associated factor glycosyltransferase family protein [Caminibacter sp.]
MSRIYQNNLKALIKTNPALGAHLASIHTNQNFEVVQQGEDNINLNIIDKLRKYPVYETDPLKEIEQKQKEIKQYERYPVLFFYGIGNGIFTKLLFANPSHKKIYVFEPNLEILFIALNIVDLSKEIESGKLEIIIPDELTFAKALNIFSHPDVQLFGKTYELQIHTPYYEKFFAESIIKLNKLLLRALKQTVINFGNDTVDTLIGIEHHIKNLPLMLQNPAFTQILKKKNSDAAIIVSTGPSLAKQLPLLKEIQDFVTIISVDASLPILAKHNIKPDFVTSLERVELTSEFFINTPQEFQKDIIMLHASLQHEKVLNNSHGKKVLVMRPFRYTKYYGFNNYGYLGIGMSAANMAYELAFLMGYKKIALIGQDLAYSEDGSSHANGHVLGEKEVKFKESDEYVTKYGGNGLIRTTRVWNMFRNFFEKDIEEAKTKGVTTFNTTEGGARIEGAVEISFKEFIDKYVKKERKKPIKLRRPPQKTIEKNLIKAHKKTAAMEKYGEKVQKKIEKVFLEVAKECENLERLKDENRLEEIDFNKLYKLTKKIDKIKDMIEKEKFSLLFGDVVQSYLVNKELDLAKIMVRPADTEIEKKAKMIEWVMQHKEWLFMLAGSINAQRIVIKRSIKNLEDELKKRNIGFTPIYEET